MVSLVSTCILILLQCSSHRYVENITILKLSPLPTLLHQWKHFSQKYHCFPMFVSATETDEWSAEGRVRTKDANTKRSFSSDKQSINLLSDSCRTAKLASHKAAHSLVCATWTRRNKYKNAASIYMYMYVIKLRQGRKEKFSRCSSSSDTNNSNNHNNNNNRCLSTNENNKKPIRLGAARQQESAKVLRMSSSAWRPNTRCRQQQ